MSPGSTEAAQGFERNDKMSGKRTDFNGFAASPSR